MSLFNSNDTIVALCSSCGPSGGISIVRISGINSFDIAEKISKLSSKEEISSCQSHTIHHGFVVSYEFSPETIDEVLFFLMRGPRTFTGDDTVEISCHNNPLIIEKIIKLAIDNGARQANRGEFTQRAVVNGKIALVQAEAINHVE